MSKNLVVFDIDGVLLEPKHRIHHWVAGEYEDYFSKALTDEPIEQGTTICRMFLRSSFQVLFVTGRGDHKTHRWDTMTMLRNYVDPFIHWNQLLMREWLGAGVPGNPDTVEKPLMIERAGYSLDHIFLVFEDKKSIIDMWRARGVTCYETQPLPL